MTLKLSRRCTMGLGESVTMRAYGRNGDAQPYRVAQGRPPCRKLATAWIFPTRVQSLLSFYSGRSTREWARADAAQGPACRTPTAPNPRHWLRWRCACDDLRGRKDTPCRAAREERFSLRRCFLIHALLYRISGPLSGSLGVPRTRGSG